MDDKTGTTTRAVYSLFGSKPELLRQLAAHAFGLLAGMIDAAPLTGDPGADLISTGMAFGAWALAHPNLFRLLITQPDAGLVTNPAVYPARHATLGRVRTRVEDARAVGLLAARPADEVIIQWHAPCARLATVELGATLMTAAKAEHIWRESLTAFLHGLSQPITQPAVLSHFSSSAAAAETYRELRGLASSKTSPTRRRKAASLWYRAVVSASRSLANSSITAGPRPQNPCLT